MHNRTGPVFMALGGLFIAAAVFMTLWNRHEDDLAGQAAQAVLGDVQNALPTQPVPQQDAATSALISPEDAQEKPPAEMTVTEIDGYGYIGTLSIPALELELPVMSEWDYERLKIAPCRELGTAQGNDLVIAGHNYKRHFGYLKDLSAGDSIFLTDMDGALHTYEVRAVETLAPTATEAVLEGGWDLTLYTCTYGGQNRVAVFCQKVDGSACAG